MRGSKRNMATVTGKSIRKGSWSKSTETSCILRKAYQTQDYAAIEGGFTGEGLEDLTGGVTTEIFSTDILDKEYFWKEELLKVNQDFLFGCAAGLFGGFGDRKGIVEGHAYSIMRAVEIDGTRLCLIRNPWGTYEWNGPWSKIVPTPIPIFYTDQI
jgi:hypothetical protein